MQYWKPVSALLISLSATLVGCQTAQPPKPQISEPVVIISEKQKVEANQQARLLFAQYAQLALDSSPMMQAYRGLKTNYDQWDDLSERFAEQEQQKVVSMLDRAKAVYRDALDDDVRLSLDLLIYELEQSIAFYPYRHYNYPVNSLYGLHTEIPTFLVNIHQIHTIQDARDYIIRIEKVPTLINQLIEQLKIREEQGILPPEFVFDTVIAACEDLITGFPIDKKSKDQHILWTALTDKMTELQLYRSSEAVLEKKLRRALQRKFKPAYLKLIKYLKKTKAKASKDTGFHQFAQGSDYYRLRLKQITTLNHDAEYIHNLGLKKVTDIQNQIFDLIPKVAPEIILQNTNKGETAQTPEAKEAEKQKILQAFFKKTRNDRSLYYSNGKQALNDSKHYIDELNKVLGKAFTGIPNMPMQVKPVEAYREANAPVAFYQSPSDDGSRPATYYMNFKKLDEMPKFQFEALAYHETIPGHHLQTIYALQSKELPEFRRHAHFTAYSEGWALYSEALPKELGAYQDPWNEYGRLLMELWRANRLVIDTGLHYKGWTINDALEYRLANTPFSKTDSINAIQRYLVMPGQATAYMMGQIKFKEIREKAERELGAKFNLGNYHQFLLELGPLPLTLLEQEIDNYIRSSKL